MRKKLFNQIENFVNKQVESIKNSIVLTTTKNGYKVNNFRIISKNSEWIVVDKAGFNVCNLRNKRLAILFAAALTKKQPNVAENVYAIDANLSILKHDKILFEHKIAKKIKPELFEDRYSRTIFELQTLNNRIFELEKSVGLQ